MITAKQKIVRLLSLLLVLGIASSVFVVVTTAIALWQWVASL